ncbi:MAG TPA: hypothetical protein VHL09_04490 [Dehalococcoidia bacterium]|nr:hypothetical protein [Dehalococcoidia bacterium]
MTRTEGLYQTYGVDHHLERSAVFQILRKRYEWATTVLYPGCFIHVTPSFYFQHVVYVDRSDLARRFFADEEGVWRLVAARKQYRPRAYVRFIGQDFTRPIPVPDAWFDLLLGLYAGGITRSCTRYLRPGGLLLTNDHAADAADAAGKVDLDLVAVMSARRRQLVIDDRDLTGYLVEKQPDPPRARRHPPFELPRHK